MNKRFRYVLMRPDGDGGAGGSGTPGGAAAALLTPAPVPGAPATLAPPAAGSPPAVGTPPAAGTPPATPPSWLEGLDDDGKKFVETKGFKTPADALKALRGSEPPESADKYDLPVPDGEDPAFAKSIAPILHKAKLSQVQAKELAEGWNAMQLQAREAAKTAEEATARETAALAERQDADLKREWGESYAPKSEHGKRAVAAFIPGDAATKMKAAQALEAVVGYTGMMKMWAAIGALIKEDTAHGMGGAGTSNLQSVAANLYDKSGMNP
jgi:hypothetical protein